MLARKIALFYRRWLQKRARTNLDSILAAARATLKRKTFCVIATSGYDASIHARVVQPSAPDEHFMVWIGTSPRSRKAEELLADDRATLIYQDDKKSACVTLIGRAKRVDDLTLRRRHFRDVWYAFFPEGPGGADFVLFQFEPERLEVIDFHRRVTPEPFGLKCAALVRIEGRWALEP